MIYENYIHQSKYARYLEEEKRRESWDETVHRYVNYLWNKWDIKNTSLDDSAEEFTAIQDAITNKEVMPSMRAMMTAGEALTRDNVAGFNCSYLPCDHPRAFDEAMYILMCGTGVGFSVEKQFTNKLPLVSEEFNETGTAIKVRDSKIGWASAYKELIALLYQGRVPEWDVSGVRAAGERLKTFGGRASGAIPLEDLFRFTIGTFKQAAGRKLTPLECHDLMCKVGDIVVVGGVRRSAMISLSDLDEDGLAKAKGYFEVVSATLLEEDKTGKEIMFKYSVTYLTSSDVELSGIYHLNDYEAKELHQEHRIGWWHVAPYRALSNNSVCYETKPTMEQFIDEWKSLYMSHSGERGIFNREAAKMLAPERRDTDHNFGTNPCSEIVLRENQFCNLSEVIVRPDDDLEDLKEKVRVATIIGTLQSTLTDFRYLRNVWKKNTEEERLLGVSMTGICDHPVLKNEKSKDLPRWLQEMRDVAIQTNKIWAKKLGIPESTSITCVKPSGTVSQLCDSSSGIHPRYNSYYIRRVRQDNKDPLTQFLKDNGVPSEPCYMKPDTTTVFAFPMKAPKGAITRQDKTAIEQLEHWLVYQKHWCEHKPSITVYVREDEWLETGAWVYKNFDYMSGVSFLPFDNGSYQQAPYTDCTKEEYDVALKAMPTEIEWTSMMEEEDNTTSSQELACTGGACEL